MKISSFSFQTEKTARVFQSGQWNDDTRNVWICLHGYGQLAEYFVKSFDGLNAADTVVFVPEGLSRFYLDEKFDRVGASWMTKVERLDDIRDNLVYLDAAWKLISDGKDISKVRITLLGFSQGTATAWRWMRHSGGFAQNLIIWAGTVPLDYSEEMKHLLKNKKLVMAYGLRDQYLDLVKGEEKFTLMKTIAPHTQIVEFADTHRIPADALKIVEEMVNS